MSNFRSKLFTGLRGSTLSQTSLAQLSDFRPRNSKIYNVPFLSLLVLFCVSTIVLNFCWDLRPEPFTFDWLYASHDRHLRSLALPEPRSSQARAAPD